MKQVSTGGNGSHFEIFENEHRHLVQYAINSQYTNYHQNLWTIEKSANFVGHLGRPFWNFRKWTSPSSSVSQNYPVYQFSSKSVQFYPYVLFLATAAMFFIGKLWFKQTWNTTCHRLLLQSFKQIRSAVSEKKIFEKIIDRKVKNC